MASASAAAGALSLFPFEKAIGKALFGRALPGDLDGLSGRDRVAAVSFVTQALRHRSGKAPAIRMESIALDTMRRQTRIVVVNDDMPFLVDSVAGVAAAHGLTVDRLLHPVIPVIRDVKGLLTALPGKGEGTKRESVIYMEIKRADAKTRQALARDITATLSHVRAAVRDWSKLREAMAADADLLPPGEEADLLHWFGDNNFTLLGHCQLEAEGKASRAMGIATHIGAALLTDAARTRALAWFGAGNRLPLILKSSQISWVHRRVPLDLIVLPVLNGHRTTALSVHAGLWTSGALNERPEAVPVLRARLHDLVSKYGLKSAGHAGKALTHALTILPHDLSVSISVEGLEAIALATMSLADRPRPKLILVDSPLRRHYFAFVWLPRDELTTHRRIAIGAMLCEATRAEVINWSINLGDGDVALIRYTLDRTDQDHVPATARISAALEMMVRGWEPAVEASLARLDGGKNATRLSIRYAGSFPASYRTQFSPDEAAQDILSLNNLSNPADRDAQLYPGDPDDAGRLRLKLYSLVSMSLSDAVPVIENFGFHVIQEVPTILAEDRGHIHEFVVAAADSTPAGKILQRSHTVEAALKAVLEGTAENDRFNELVVTAALEPFDVVLFRALFRYLRQIGLSFGLVTMVDALRRAGPVTQGLVALFDALHNPAMRKSPDAVSTAKRAIDRGLAGVTNIEDDRILRLLRSIIVATLRTNAFAPAAREALALKIDSALIPGLPAPVPWREIFVYSPRVEGIHLRAGPIARGGLRWSDRRDDFRTEILGLMKAQRVKNAVIVPTGAKGGFYPKHLPDPANRDAWLAEGTESYRIFIRTLLSVTDNIVGGKLVHPEKIVIHDGEDPYFVVAADKGTATFSDVANAIAAERNFWLGDAFASGGSFGYDHKAMGITAKGGWVSVQRHFAESGVDVQSEPVRVVGCGDMSGDVFGNGMLLSRTLKIVAAFDHRHIFIDPDPDPETSWQERARLFALLRSSWADYDKALISPGGGVFARTEKLIQLSKQVRAALDIDATSLDPSALIAAILQSPADLIWFGGIGTYIKARGESHADVGDRANDAHRVNAEEVRAKVIGEGANLGVTQAARIAFALRSGRINTDFIDNSAGVDCSDNEVNIKIALGTDTARGTLTMARRNALLASMTAEVGALVLQDNRLQTLMLSIAERGGAKALPAQIRLIENFEAGGQLDRAVEGIAGNDVLARRAAEGHGLTRPELAVLLATAKLILQDAIEDTSLGQDDALLPDLLAAFPKAMRKRHAAAITGHRLRSEIIATKLANKIINRMGLIHPFELAEEEGATLGDVAHAFVVAERLHDADMIWDMIDNGDMAEETRLMLFEQVAVELRAHMADVLRNGVAGRSTADAISVLRPGMAKLDASIDTLLPKESRVQTQAFAGRLTSAGAPTRIVDRVVRLAELDGAIGIAALGLSAGFEVTALTRAFTALGEALGIDWAQGHAMQLNPRDPWERLLSAGLARDFQAMRLEFLSRAQGTDPEIHVTVWLAANAARVESLRATVQRARGNAAPTTAMFAQIASQTRALLGR
jgi:glutamate dehydrogenase